MKKKDGLKQTGKRKRAIARVSIKPGSGKISVNGIESKDYFRARRLLHDKITRPFEISGTLGQYDVTVSIKGGGKVGQADAVTHGIARALAQINKTNRTSIKAAGLLTRDSRIKESKKYGRKKARKRFQFSKR
jgi:small subunit ribosomal protein S9